MKAFLPFLLTMSHGGGVSHSVRLPYVAYNSAVHHIHSPEHFLRAHGLSYPGFVLEESHPPVGSRDYQVVALTYRSLLGRYHARVFTNDPSVSEFLLLDDDGAATVAGQLRVVRHEVRGVTVVCHASRVRPAGLLEALLAPPRVSPERVEAAIVAGCHASEEDAHLRAYRTLVLRRCEERPDPL